jgi:hypothetical protein
MSYFMLAANGLQLGEGGDFHHLGSTEIDAESALGG